MKIDYFWVESEFQQNAKSTTKIAPGASGCRHTVKIENSSCFPITVNIGGNIPHKATGLMFSNQNYEWKKDVQNLKPKKSQTRIEDVDTQKSNSGTEYIDAGIYDYINLDTGVLFSPSAHLPITLSIEVK